MMKHIAKFMNLRFFVLLFVCGAAGVIAAAYANIYVAAALALILAAGLFRDKRKWLLLPLFLFCSGLYADVAVKENNSKAVAFREKSYTVTGTIDSLISEDGQRADFTIKNLTLDGIKYKGRARVYLDGATDAKQGDKVVFTGAASMYFLNASVPTSVITYNRRIFYRVDTYEISVIGEGGIAAVRERAENAIKENMSPGNYGVVYALIFGDASAIEAETYGAYRNSGVIHIFSVSGLHMSFFFLLVTSVLSFLKLKKTGKYIIALLLCLAYAYLCDFRPSVIRALIMLAIMSFADILGRKYDSFNALGFSGAAILLINPIYLFDLGFLLSFFAVYGIIAFNKYFERPFKKTNAFTTAFTMSISANIGVFNLLNYYMEGLTLIAYLANIIVVPVIAVLFPVLICVLLISYFIPYAGVLLRALDPVLTAMTSLMGFTEGHTRFLKINMSAIGMLLYLVFIFIISRYYIAERKKKTYTALTVAALLLTDIIYSAIVNGA